MNHPAAAHVVLLATKYVCLAANPETTPLHIAAASQTYLVANSTT